jgi:predicted transcriptional regulator
VSQLSQLSRRERQIMEIVYSKGEATATDVLENLDDAPRRTAVRTFLRILEEKGHLKHTKRGREFLFRPVHRRDRAGKSAFQGVLRTFFGGSLEKAVAAHLTHPGSKVSPSELQRLAALIKEARRKEDQTKPGS